MGKTIYVKLLNEGTDVYRPVTATDLGNNIYKIDESNLYDTEDELWEFPTGSCVEVTEKIIDKESILVAYQLSR
ncbi:hypothetical protein GCM10027049_26910 [Mucilaginibacter puniceus]